jgi:predicted DNA-binding transcriptional regulator AlpA
MQDELIDTPALAKILRTSESYLNKLRCSGAGPRFIRLGRRVRYRLSDVEAFLASNACLSTSDEGPLSGRP